MVVAFGVPMRYRNHERSCGRGGFRAGFAIFQNQHLARFDLQMVGSFQINFRMRFPLLHIFGG